MKASRVTLFAIVVSLIACGKVNTTEEVSAGSLPPYSIIWKYKIKPEHREKFEYEYGPQGSWVKVFGKSDQYVGSFLHQSDAEPDTYILIDVWRSKRSYEDFKRVHEQTYNQLSDKFTYLYVLEELVGTFNAIT